MTSNNTLKQKNKLIKELESKCNKLFITVNSICKSIEELQSGDNGEPYWNGSNAYDIIKRLIAQAEQDMELIDQLTNCIKILK